MSAGAQIECAGAKAWFCLREYLIHAFLGRLLPAERREGRDNPTFAYAAQRSASGFLSLRGNSGLTIDKRRANSLFPRAAPRCRVKKAKAWFCLFQVFKERWRVYNSPARRGARVRTLCAVMSAYSCLPPWGKVSRSDGRGAHASIFVIPTERSEWRDLVLDAKAVPNTALFLPPPSSRRFVLSAQNKS